jgi:two-component system, NtrC family, response regulator HydG
MTAPASPLRLPVLLVDDDAPFLLSASMALRVTGIAPVVTLQDSRQVMPFLAGNGVSAVVVDLVMPHLSGHELLPRIREEFPQLPVLVMTGTDEVEVAVACMKDGAFDYLVKPVETGRFVASIRRALEMRGMRDEISTLKQHLLSGQLSDASAFSDIVTDSRKMLALFQYVEVVAATAHPVLITGETGTGKELIARAVHALSGRRGPFLPVNVAGLDDAMFSDTLFGHRRGAFTGADQAREGLIAEAAAGTLFLDEIGDLKESSQVKLLRLLEGGEYYPLGSDAPRRSDARVICATHRNLPELLAAGTFRKDLYYRLSAHQVHLPPLRERPEDIALLVDCFLEEAAASQRKKKPAVPSEVITLLSSCPFPGNVRELRALVFDAMIQHKGGSLSVDLFRKAVRGERTTERAEGGSEEDGVPFRIGRRFPTLKEAESHLIAEAMRRARNNQGIAATLLGITRQALNKRLVRGSSRKKFSEDPGP